MKEGQPVKITKFKGQPGRIIKKLPPDDYGNEFLVEYGEDRRKKYGVFKKRDIEKRTLLVEYPPGSVFYIFDGKYELRYKEKDNNLKTHVVLKQIEGPEKGKIITENEDGLAYVDYKLVRRPKWKNI